MKKRTLFFIYIQKFVFVDNIHYDPSLALSMVILMLVSSFLFFALFHCSIRVRKIRYDSHAFPYRSQPMLRDNCWQTFWIQTFHDFHYIQTPKCCNMRSWNATFPAPLKNFLYSSRTVLPMLVVDVVVRVKSSRAADSMRVPCTTVPFSVSS